MGREPGSGQKRKTRANRCLAPFFRAAWNEIFHFVTESQRAMQDASERMCLRVLTCVYAVTGAHELECSPPHKEQER